MGLLIFSLLAYPVVLQRVPELVPGRISQPPKVDGSLDDPCWQSLAWHSLSQALRGEPAGEVAFAIGYDEKNLYIAVRVKESQPTVNHRENESNIWEDSCIEVFLGHPLPGIPLRTYRHYILNAEGYRMDEIASEGAGSWNGNWEGKVGRGGEYWTAEIRIPAGDMELSSFKEGMVLSLNLTAQVFHPTNKLLSFAPVEGTFHCPKSFVPLIIGEKPPFQRESILVIRGYSQATPFNVSLPEESKWEAFIRGFKAVSQLKPGSYGVDIFQKRILVARYALKVPWFSKEGIGEVLGENSSLLVWTADPMRKIFKEQKPPAQRGSAIRMLGAKGEWEMAQVIFTPLQDIDAFSLRVTNLQGPGTIPASRVRIYKVEYVPITIPTDPDGEPGDYPDPLVEVKGSLNLEGGINHPFILDLLIPPNAKAGTYKGKVEAYSKGKKLIEVPIELRVLNFSLPQKPKDFHLHTAYGMNVNLEYHKASPQDLEKIFPYYLQMLAEHHISPYDPFLRKVKYNLQGESWEVSNGELSLTFPTTGATIATLSQKGSVMGTLSFCLDAREKETVSWPGLERVKPEVVLQGPLRCKVRVKGEKLSSSLAQRRYEVLEEIEVFRGQKWFTRRLLTLRSTDDNPYFVPLYFLLLSPSDAGAEAVNGEGWGMWRTEEGILGALETKQGDFNFALRRDEGGGFHGDVTRTVNLEMEKGKGLDSPQPALVVFCGKGEDQGALLTLKEKLTHPLDVSLEREGDSLLIRIKETRGIARKEEPLVVLLPEGINWRFIGVWDGAKEVPSQLDGRELTLLVDVPANGEKVLRAREAKSPWKGEGIRAKRKPPKVEVDFSAFEGSAKYALDHIGFSDYNLTGVLDMGWLWRWEGISEEEAKLYEELGRKVEDFLGKRGWLKRTYCYWLDEPEESAYPFVIGGMKLLKRTFPHVRRLLTEQPEPPLYGYVDLWVPVFHLYDQKRCQERQRKREEVWWYVCCAPRHPYPNNFIDYPGIEHRIRLWMNWKYNVTGDLYWSTTYWHKNPWRTPMSYTPDDRGMWGNGDGYLLYPPERGEPKGKVLTGPLPSLRIKLIREGIEDAEYLWMLEERVKGMANPPKEAINALEEARGLVRSQTDFETSPERLQEVRRKVGLALEKLISR